MKILESHFKYKSDIMIPGENMNKEYLLFFDIETTGFSAKNCDLYMIGVAYLSSDIWIIKQYLAENSGDEIKLIDAFFNYIKNYNILVHYNGEGFDIPFIRQKCRKYHIDTSPIDNIKSFDIYKKISQYRHIFPMENIKQKSVETFLGINRRDEMDGGQLISIYKNYVKNQNPDNEQLLLCHNHDDIEGLILITPILQYINILKGNYKDYSIDLNEYIMQDGNNGFELNIRLIFDENVITPFSFNIDGVYFKLSGNTLFISIKAVKGEFKYFFKDYKNYYYLPIEDMAVHKSVASYVDKTYRESATASNCYIKKHGIFLPSFSIDNYKIFKKDYKDKKSYIMCSEELIQDDNFAESYIKSIFSIL